MMSKFTRVVWLSGVLALGLSLAVPDNSCGGVRLQGSYDYVVRPENRTPLFSARYNFEVIIAGCSWIISYEDLSAATNANVLNVRATASCDGTNIYLVQYHSESAVKNVWGRRYDSVKQELAMANAKIFPGNYPPPEEFTLHTIWFALSANCVLGASTGRAKPLQYADLAVFYGRADYDSGYVRTVDQHNPGTHLITLTNDGSFLVRDEVDGRVRRFLYAPPYDEGFVEGVGVWRGVTNVGDVRVANQFEFTGFAPKYEHQPNTSGRGHSKSFERTLFFRCTVTNIAAATIGEIPPQLPNFRVFIIDRRLANEGWARIAYHATNVWLPLEDVMKIAQSRPKSSFESEVLVQIGARAPATKSAFVKYLICLLLALPLGLWALGAVRNRKQKQTKVLE